MQIKPIGKNNKAYTLLGMAIALAVAGLIISGALGYYKVYKQNARVESTVYNTNKIMEAVSSFLVQNGRYPCPAPIDTAPGATGYGLEVANCSNPTPVYVAGGLHINGLWVEQKNITPAVLIVRGAIPFRTLNLPEYMSLDSYNQRFEYAVTLDLTSRATYIDNGGGISINDVNGISFIPVADTADFLVLSHGRDRIGGYNKEGLQFLSCGTVTNPRTAELDAENCNTATDLNAIYISSSMADLDVGDIDHFDDYVGFYTVPDKAFWKAYGVTGSHIYYGDSGVIPNPAKTPVLVIGRATGEVFNSSMKLDVNGNILATGDIRTDYICDNSKNERDSSSNSSYCLSAEDISTGFSCLAGQYVESIDGYGPTGIRVNCSASINFTCSEGEVMTGFDTANKIICDSPPPLPLPIPNPLTGQYKKDTSCPSQDVRVCANLGFGAEYITLAAATKGAISTATTLLGGDYTATYECRNRGWIFRDSSGTCDTSGSPSSPANICNIDNLSVNIGTKSYAPWAFYNSAGGGGNKNSWTGEWNVDVIKTAISKVIIPPSTVKVSNFCPYRFFNVGTSAINPITCNSGDTEQYIEACPANSTTATVENTKTWGCSPAGWSATITNTCVSAGGSYTSPPRTLLCPEGLKLNLGVCSPIGVTLPASATTRIRQIPCSSNSAQFADLTETRSFDTILKTWSEWIKLSVTACYNLGGTVALPAAPGEWIPEAMPVMELLDKSNTIVIPPILIDSYPALKSFTVTAGMPYFVGQPIYFISRGKRSHVIYGTVSSYIGASLTMSVTAPSNANGTTSRSDWDIYVAEPQFMGEEKKFIESYNVSTAPATGIKTFTLTTGKPYFKDESVYFINATNSLEYMFGHIISYSGNILKVNFNIVNGTTNRPQWDIYVTDSSYRGKGTPRRAGDSCPILNIKRSCYAPAGNGKYYDFKDCICQ